MYTPSGVQYRRRGALSIPGSHLLKLLQRMAGSSPFVSFGTHTPTSSILPSKPLALALTHHSDSAHAICVPSSAQRPPGAPGSPIHERRSLHVASGEMVSADAESVRMAAKMAVIICSLILRVVEDWFRFDRWPGDDRLLLLIATGLVVTTTSGHRGELLEQDTNIWRPSCHHQLN